MAGALQSSLRRRDPRRDATFGTSVAPSGGVKRNRSADGAFTAAVVKLSVTVTATLSTACSPLAAMRLYSWVDILLRTMT